MPLWLSGKLLHDEGSFNIVKACRSWGLRKRFGLDLDPQVLRFAVSMGGEQRQYNLAAWKKKTYVKTQHCDISQSVHISELFLTLDKHC